MPRPLGRRDFLRLANGVGLGALATALTGCSFLENTASASSRSFLSLPGVKVPKVLVGSSAKQPAGLFFVTASGGTGETGPMIFDQAGQPVWFNPRTGTPTANLRVQRYRNQPILTWWEGSVANGYGQGNYIGVDQEYHEVFQLSLGNGLAGDLHEFLITEHDTALVCAYQTRLLTGGQNVLDCVIQEVAIPSGDVRFEWRAADHVKPSASYAEVPSDASAFDFFHSNAIDPYDDQHLLISSRNTWTIYKVAKTDGHIVWRLGGKYSDFSQPEDTRFEWQHDARWIGGGLTLFDNGADPKVEAQSRALILDVDEAARTTALRQQFLHPKAPSAGSQGNAQRLADGSMVVGWGAQPYVTHHAPDGTVLLDATLPEAMYSYRAFLFEWEGRPTTQPQVSFNRDLTGGVTARASWNGATQIDRWEIWAGRGDQPRLVARQRKTAFETTLHGHATESHFEVRAFDTGGALLGTTAFDRGPT